MHLGWGQQKNAHELLNGAGTHLHGSTCNGRPQQLRPARNLLECWNAMSCAAWNRFGLGNRLPCCLLTLQSSAAWSITWDPCPTAAPPRWHEAPTPASPSGPS